MPTPVPGLDPRALLQQVLADPFGLSDDLLINHWLTYLSENFPLLSFRSSVYAAAYPTSVPLTYPLQDFIDSILQDDLVLRDTSTGPVYGNPLEPPLVQIDQRRAALAHVEYDAYGRVGSIREFMGDVTPCSPSFRSAPEPTEIDWDDEGPVGTHSPYEDIGRELVERLEAVRAAATKQAHKNAQKELNDFLNCVGALSTGGRPAKGPNEELLKALLDELRRLIALIADAVPVTPSAPSMDLFGWLDVRPGDAEMWALRLALPVLSGVELQVLADSLNRSVSPPKWRSNLSPVRLTVWIYAHRLRIPAESLNRKARGKIDAVYFASATDPFPA